ncbi:nickel ABC transporter substrate-binding protein [Paenibacillus sp. sgz302251]|uniref:nickel ABC transporter substrate-binding protein n=1 Tax=Paenibacillus sp. sgz302251 TaxID=3414493 RepID=UPI003C7DE121
MNPLLHTNRRIIARLLVLLLIVALMAACGKENEAVSSGENGAAEAEKSVTIIRNFKAASLDPHNSWETLRAGIVETLVRLDENLEVTEWLATKWEAIDEVTWLFTIREGVTFQDGSILDAAAVKASFERGILASGVLAGSLKIASMEADGNKLTVVTTEPHPALPSELVNPYASVISVAAEQVMGTEAFNLAPIGTGPFKVVHFTPNIEAELARYEGYWDGPAKLNKVIYKFNEDSYVRALALQSKEADIVYSVPSETVATIEQDQALHVESIAGLRVHYLLYNQQKPVMADVSVRQAIDLLLNRESIAKDILLGNGTPATGPFNSSLPFGIKEAAAEAKPQLALKLLENAGYKRNASDKLEKDGKELVLELATYGARPELPLIAQLLQSDAAKIGVTINISTVENADAYIRENKDWDIVTYSNLSAPRGDGGYYLNSAFMPGGSLNGTNVENKAVMAVVNKLNATSDVAERVKLTKEAVSLVLEDVTHSYAVYPNLIVGMNNRVTGWKPGPEEYYIVTNLMDVK